MGFSNLIATYIPRVSKEQGRDLVGGAPEIPK